MKGNEFFIIATTDLRSRFKSALMGNKNSSKMKRSNSQKLEKKKEPFVVQGKALYQIVQDPQHVAECWSFFSNEDMVDAIPLEEHCDGDRYYSRFVYTHSKVKLKGGRYINANYVLNREYIASQAPLSHTMAPFWEMIFQEKVQLIVMLTKVVEGTRTKALRYWPTSNHPIQNYDDGEYGEEDKWRAELIEKSVFEDNILRRDLKITRTEDGRERNVIQLQYIGWPDHGCPSEIAEVIALLCGVDQIVGDSKAPIVIHCSAGIGRTGTFITIRHELKKAVASFQILDNYDALKELPAKEQVQAIREFLLEYTFEIDDTVRELRKDRKMMVQKEEQLMFCYEVFFYIVDSNEENDYILEEFIAPIFFPL